MGMSGRRWCFVRVRRDLRWEGLDRSGVENRSYLLEQFIRGERFLENRGVPGEAEGFFKMIPGIAGDEEAAEPVV